MAGLPLICSVCGDEMAPFGDGGDWGGKLVCADCEVREFAQVNAARNGVETYLLSIGVDDAGNAAIEVMRAIMLAECLIIPLRQYAESVQILRNEIAELRERLGEAD